MISVHVSIDLLKRLLRQHFGVTGLHHSVLTAIQYELVQALENDLKAGKRTSVRECLSVAIDTVNSFRDDMEVDLP
jgi:hypothetical protein